MSSNNAVYNGKSRCHSTNDGQNDTLRRVPNNPTYNIDRFISRNSEIADQLQRPQLALRQTEQEAEAIAEAEARATALLRAFDTQFSTANN